MDLKENKFKVFEKLTGEFLKDTFTPYNCLINIYEENNLIFLPYTGNVKEKDIFEGDIVKSIDYNYLDHSVGETYFAIVTFSKKKLRFIFKESGTEKEYEIDDYDFEEIVGNVLTHSNFIEGVIQCQH